jgi:hypothetical protein
MQCQFFQFLNQKNFSTNRNTADHDDTLTTLSNGVGLHLLFDLVCSLTTVASRLSIHLQFNESYHHVICKLVAGCVPLVQITNFQLVEKVVPLPQEIDFFFFTVFPADFNLPEGLGYKILNGFVALH